MRQDRGGWRVRAEVGGMNCGVCRTLYPVIMAAADEICRSCVAAGEREEVDLHEAAEELERELARWPGEPVLAVVER